MKWLSTILLLFSVFLTTKWSIAQSEKPLITLLNGETISVKIIREDSIAYYYEVPKKRKVKTKSLSKAVVYSIQYGDSLAVIYEQDTLSGLYLTPEEMQYYIWGAQDAEANAKAGGYTIAGFLLSAGAGYYAYNSMAVIATPILVTSFSGLTGINMKKAEVREEALRENYYYQQGYKKRLRSKRVYNALRASIIGTVVGVAAGNLAN